LSYFFFFFSFLPFPVLVLLFISSIPFSVVYLISPTL
jgi:hypothetical protein